MEISKNIDPQLEYFLAQKDILRWTNEKNYEDIFLDSVNFIPNRDGTITILSMIQQDHPLYFPEQMMIMSRINKPIIAHVWDEEDECRYCKKTGIIHTFDISMYSIWRPYIESLDGGVHILLCNECIDKSQLLFNIGIIICDKIFNDSPLLFDRTTSKSGISKAIVRYNKNDVIFLVETVIPMKCIHSIPESSNYRLSDNSIIFASENNHLYCHACNQRSKSGLYCTWCNQKINSLIYEILFRVFIISNFDAVKDVQQEIIFLLLDVHS